MTTVTQTLDEVIEALREGVGSLRAGDYEVRDVVIERGSDSQGRDAVFLVVVLEDPTEETWPLDDVLALLRDIDDLAIKLRVPLRWYVRMEAATPPDFDPEDLVPSPQA